MRSISRVAGVSINTVTKLLVDAGKACAEYHDANVCNVKSKRVQCDEIWSFCYSKAKNTPDERKLEGAGDVWTWTAIDADSKLIISYIVGNRDAAIMLDDSLPESEKPELSTPAFRGPQGLQSAADRKQTMGIS